MGLNRVGRSLRLLAVAVLAIFLSGCQFSGHASDPGVIHLTLWHGVNPPPNRVVLQQLVDRFNATHPTIQIEAVYIGQGDQQIPKLLSAVVGNVPPTMLWYAPTLTGQLVELEAIRPLENWLAASPVAAELDPSLIDSMQWEDHVWSVPFGVNNVGIFYRPSLFEAAGIQQLPASWEELRDAARRLTKMEAGSPQYGLLLPLGKGEWTVFMWLPFLWSAGGTGLVQPSGAPMVETPEAIAALQFWRSLVEDGSVMLSQPERGYELDDFLTGRVAMQLTGPWTLRQLRETGVDFGVMPIPENVERATATGGENLFIFKTTPEAERAAWMFAEYVLSEEFQTEWAMGTGYLPVNLKSRQSRLYQDFVAQQPVLRVFLEQAPLGRSRPITPGYSRLSEQVGRAIEAALLGQSAPDAALQDAQARLNLILEN